MSQAIGRRSATAATTLLAGKERFDLRNWHFDGMREIHTLRNCHDYR